MAATGHASTSLHRALADPRRVRVVEELEEHPDGLGVEDLAGRVGLHANTVRWHLGVLARAGLVESAPEPRSAPGRPRILYRAGARAGSPDGARDEYRLLASVLAGIVSGSPDREGVCDTAGRAWGHELLHGRTAADEKAAVAEITGLLAEQGFEPEAGEREIEMRRCPFHDLAETNPEVVCAVHRGLISGALAELGSPLEVEELEVFPRPGVCVARLARG
jgi:predicted ArsR family transcriptional regulator